MRAPQIVRALLPVFDRRQPALAEFAEARINDAAIALMRLPVNGDGGIDGDRDFAAQAIERQALDQFLRQRGLAIDQQFPVARRPDEKIEHRLALRAQQSGIDRQGLVEVVRDETLEKGGDAFVRAFRYQADDRAVVEAGGDVRHG